MINKFCKTPLWEASMTLAATAQGRTPAETVIRGAKLVNVCTGEILENVDVAVAMGRIALAAVSYTHLEEGGPGRGGAVHPVP